MRSAACFDWQILCGYVPSQTQSNTAANHLTFGAEKNLLVILVRHPDQDMNEGLDTHTHTHTLSQQQPLHW